MGEPVRDVLAWGCGACRERMRTRCRVNSPTAGLHFTSGSRELLIPIPHALAMFCDTSRAPFPHGLHRPTFSDNCLQTTKTPEDHANTPQKPTSLASGWSSPYPEQSSVCALRPRGAARAVRAECQHPRSPGFAAVRVPNGARTVPHMRLTSYVAPAPDFHDERETARVTIERNNRFLSEILDR